MSLVAGLALIEALDVALPGLPTMLKWPNDLMLSNSKAAGVLAERSGNRVIIGFGVNLGKPPELADRKAASFEGRIQPVGFAPLLAGSFARTLDRWRSSDLSSLVGAWEERAHPVGANISVHVGQGERLTGRFGGLDPDGALRLERDDGTLDVIRAADVEL